MKNFFLISMFYSALCSAQIPAGAVGDWPFDNNALDMSGNGNNGIVNGATPAPDRFGQPNMAYRFNGANSKVTVPHSNSIDVASGVDFTFAYWQKSYTGNVDKVILSKHSPGTWNGYNFIANNQSDFGYCTSSGHMYFYAAAGAFDDACSNGAVISNDTLWHFIVGMYKAATNQTFLYVDNVLQSDIGQSAGNMSNTSNMSFGYDDDLNSLFYNGVLDGARLYKRILTPAELTALYNEAGCAAPSNPTNSTTLGNKIICKNQRSIVSANGAGTISWYSSLTSGTLLGSGSSYTTPILSAGVYTYYAAATTCTNSSRTAITVTVNECAGMISRTELITSSKVYPNPSNGIIHLNLETVYQNAEVVIVNQIGEVVYSAKIAEKEFTLETNLPNGLYFLNLINNKQVFEVKKLIIQH